MSETDINVISATHTYNFPRKSNVVQVWEVQEDRQIWPHRKKKHSLKVT